MPLGVSHARLAFWSRSGSGMKTTAAAAIAALLVGVAPAFADQQQWAAAYVDWTFAESAPQAWMIDQDVWIPQPGLARYFTVNWNFTAGDNGYMGLQTDESGVGNVRFSLWNATDARGVSCRPFDGEGVGSTCELPVTINPNTIYRLRIWRTNSDASGQWWAGYLISLTAGGELVQTMIGEIKVAKSRTLIEPGSIGNFSEYWGQQVARCSEVSPSAAVYLPPGINFGGGDEGMYQAVAIAPSPRTPDDNICSTGNESRGAIARHVPIEVAGETSMLITLGGSKAANNALTARVSNGPTPGKLPAS